MIGTALYDCGRDVYVKNLHFPKPRPRNPKSRRKVAYRYVSAPRGLSINGGKKLQTPDSKLLQIPSFESQ